MSLILVFTDYTKANPGPGAYEPIKATESKLGRVANSRFRSPGAPIISRGNERFDFSHLRRSILVPGPGAYPHA